MLKKFRLLLVLALLLVSNQVIASDDEIIKLQRQLSARDAAMLEMQNRINAQEESMRVLQGSIEDLNYRLSQMSETQKNLLSEIDVLKQGNKYDQPPVVANKPEAPAPVVQPTPTPNPAKADEATKLYNSAMAKVKAGDYKSAEDIFNDFIVKYPNSELVANSYYWVGQLNYNQKKYAAARQNFLSVTSYKNSGKRAEAIYKLGQVSEALKETDKAKKFYQLVIKQYPNDTAAALAKQSLSKLK